MEITGEMSDEYHTFNELYEYRKQYNAALFNEWAKLEGNPYKVHKSSRHSDGEPCFEGGWFIVKAKITSRANIQPLQRDGLGCVQSPLFTDSIHVGWPHPSRRVSTPGGVQ